MHTYTINLGGETASLETLSSIVKKVFLRQKIIFAQQKRNEEAVNTEVGQYQLVDFLLLLFQHMSNHA